MIDTLVTFSPQIEKATILEELKVIKGGYALMTMHRPATVDYKVGLLKLIEVIKFITIDKLLVFPIHPRTKHRLESFGLYNEMKAIDGLILCPPIGYFEFQKLIKYAVYICLLYTSPSPRDATLSRMPSSA